MSVEQVAMTHTERVVGVLRECGVEAKLRSSGGVDEVYARAAGVSLLTSATGSAAVGPVGRRPRAMTLGPVVGAGHQGLWGPLRVLDILYALEGVPRYAIEGVPPRIFSRPAPTRRRLSLLPAGFPCAVDDSGSVEAVGLVGQMFMAEQLRDRLIHEAGVVGAELEIFLAWRADEYGRFNRDGASLRGLRCENPYAGIDTSARGTLVCVRNPANGWVHVDPWARTIDGPDGKPHQIPNDYRDAGIATMVFRYLRIDRGTGRVRRLPTTEGGAVFEYTGGRRR